MYISFKQIFENSLQFGEGASVRLDAGRFVQRQCTCKEMVSRLFVRVFVLVASMFNRIGVLAVSGRSPCVPGQGTSRV